MAVLDRGNFGGVYHIWIQCTLHNNYIDTNMGMNQFYSPQCVHVEIHTYVVIQRYAHMHILYPAAYRY